MIYFAAKSAEGVSAVRGVGFGVDVPDVARSCRGVAVSRPDNASLSDGWNQSTSRSEIIQHGCVKPTNTIGSNHLVAPRSKIGRNVMTVLAFRSRGRHRTGVPALQLIASARTVNAPVCGNCTSINLSEHEDPGFGDYFVCEDCMTQLDTDGSRI